ncbi:MAG: hypothetical protein ACJATV_000956 [Granulosicoccus sp.]|jgi:hypothetical protein
MWPSVMARLKVGALYQTASADRGFCILGTPQHSQNGTDTGSVRHEHTYCVANSCLLGGILIRYCHQSFVSRHMRC